MLQTAAAAEQARQDAVAEAGPLGEQLARLKREQQAAQKEKRDLLQRCRELSQEVATLHVSLPPLCPQDVSMPIQTGGRGPRLHFVIEVHHFGIHSARRVLVRQAIRASGSPGRLH